MPISEIVDYISTYPKLKKYEENLLAFEAERSGHVNLYLNILTDCKDNKKILDCYYRNLYYYISLIQISVIFISTVSAFFQALQTDTGLSQKFISIFSLCISTYISFILSLAKFFQLDEKKEKTSNLSEKYSQLHNKIRYILDSLKPWKDPWFLKITNIEKKLEEWKAKQEALNNDYTNLIEMKQTITTDYENVMQSERKIKKYKLKILKNDLISKEIEDNLKDRLIDSDEIENNDNIDND